MPSLESVSGTEFGNAQGKTTRRIIAAQSGFRPMTSPRIIFANSTSAASGCTWDHKAFQSESPYRVVKWSQIFPDNQLDKWPQIFQSARHREDVVTFKYGFGKQPGARDFVDGVLGDVPAVMFFDHRD